MNRRVLLFGVLAALAVVVLWWIVLWSPQSSKLDDAKADREAAAAQNQLLRLQKARLEETGNNRPELENRLNALEVAIPDTPNLAEFILDTNDAAAQSGVDVTSITPTPPAQEEGVAVPEMHIDLDVKGGYFQVIDFLNRLDELGRIFVVDTLNVTAEPDTSGPPELTATLGGRLFLTTLTPVAAAAGDETSTTTSSTSETTTSTTATFETSTTSTVTSSSSTSTTEAP